MTAKTLSSYTMLPSCPATDALRIVEATKGKRRSSGFDGSLSSSLFDLSFSESKVESFPTIAWESDDEFDSFSSLPSLDTLISHDSTSSLGRKRPRSDSSSRRLVRSRKIKSGLSSLAIPMSITTAS